MSRERKVECGFQLLIANELYSSSMPDPSEAENEELAQVFAQGLIVMCDGHVLRDRKEIWFDVCRHAGTTVEISVPVVGGMWNCFPGMRFGNRYAHAESGEDSEAQQEAVTAASVVSASALPVSAEAATTGRRLLPLGPQNPATENPNSCHVSVKFDRHIDDEQMLRAAFDTLDYDKNGIICIKEIETAMNANPDEDSVMRGLLRSLESKDKDGDKINFDQFKKCADATPRIKGQRVEWASSLGLEAAFAQYLEVGDLFDPLKGIRNMTDEELERACAVFSSQDLFRLVREGRDSLSRRDEAKIFQNSKFCLDESFTGTFAELSDFYDGPEKLIGAPNPNVRLGMEREHCERPNRQDKYTSTNYKFEFSPSQEWDFVVKPDRNVAYPHTPAEKGSWKVPAGQSWKGDHGRHVVTLEDVMARKQVATFGLKEGEIIALRLYTGPMFNLYNAVLRKHPHELFLALKENKYETTLFCIISGILKISRRTEVPPDRRLWRGLGGMILPQKFWGTTNSSDAFRGGVEKGLMSTTTNRQVAIQYSGRDKKRGTIFEIEAGRIDIGADLKWLSQYPGESEYLFPPLSCLEVNGEPRLEGDVIVFPLRVNVCLKGLTLEQLEARRKILHIAMTDNLQEELAIESNISTLLQILQKKMVLSTERKQDIEKSLENPRAHVMKEFQKKIDAQKVMEIKDFNNDKNYKVITTVAIEAKSHALDKIQFYADCLGLNGTKALLDRVLDCPFEDISIRGKKEELRTGLSTPFPWRDLVENKDVVDFGTWNPQSVNDSSLLDLALTELARHDFRVMRINQKLLNFENCWATETLKWENCPAVQASPGMVAFIIRNCKNLTNLSLRGNNMKEAAWSDFVDSFTFLPSLSILNNTEGFVPLFRGSHTKINLAGKDLGGNELLLPLSFVLGNSASCLTDLDLSCNSIYKDGLRICSTLSVLKSLTVLDISNNGIGEDMYNSLTSSLKYIHTLNYLNLAKNKFSKDKEKSLPMVLPHVKTILLVDHSMEKGQDSVENVLERVVETVEVPVERMIEVPVDRIVEKFVNEKIITKEVPVEKVVEVPVEVYVDRQVMIESPVERIVTKEVTVPVERRVEVPVEVYIERQVMIESPVERIVIKEVPVEKVVGSARPVGLGLSLECHGQNSKPWVGAIIPGFAADRNGELREGDVIVAIDGEEMDKYTLDEIKSKTVGPEGSICTLQVLRDNKYFEVSLCRMIPDSADGMHHAQKWEMPVEQVEGGTNTDSPQLEFRELV